MASREGGLVDRIQGCCHAQGGQFTGLKGHTQEVVVDVPCPGAHAQRLGVLLRPIDPEQLVPDLTGLDCVPGLGVVLFKKGELLFLEVARLALLGGHAPPDSIALVEHGHLLKRPDSLQDTVAIGHPALLRVSGAD